MYEITYLRLCVFSFKFVFIADFVCCVAKQLNIKNIKRGANRQLKMHDDYEDGLNVIKGIRNKRLILKMGPCNQSILVSHKVQCNNKKHLKH